jgi:hypothetical protein
MIAKSYKNGDVEIIMTKIQDKPVYGVVRIVRDGNPNVISNRTYEDANEVYDYFLDMELGADK